MASRGEDSVVVAPSNVEASSSSSATTSSSTPTPVFSYWRDPGGALRQWYMDPQAWQQWYATLQHGSYPLSSSATVATPPFSSFPAANVMLESMSASLKALQSQFTTFQERTYADIDTIKTDVKEALSMVNNVRTAQSKTDKCIAGLEDVIGVSSTSVGSRGRRTRGRGRGKRGRVGSQANAPPEVECTEIGVVPEKTLIQSVASIQSAIEVLLARDSHRPPSYIYQVDPSPPSVNQLAGQASGTSESLPLPLVVDPSQPWKSMQSTFAVSLTSHPSSSSSRLSSIVIPTPKCGTSPSPTVPEKGYSDESIQAYMTSSTSVPSSYSSDSHGHAPGFTLVDWNVGPASLGKYDNNSARSAAYTAECPTRDNSDHPLRNLTASDNQLQPRVTPASTSPPHLDESNTVTQSTDSNQPSTIAGSLDTSVTPLASDTTILTKNLPSPAGNPIQNSGQLHVFPLTSPLTSLSTHDTPMSVCGEVQLDYPGQPHGDLEDNMSSATSGSKLVPGFTPPAPGIRRLSPPVEASDARPPSGLPTPPAETVTGDRDLGLVSRSTHEDTTRDPKPTLCSHSRDFPVIPTPPFLTPEPSTGENREMASTDRESVRPGSLTSFPEGSSPLTPSLFTSSSAGGSSADQDTAGMKTQAGDQNIVGGHTDSPDVGGGQVVCRDNATAGAIVDVVVDDARFTPRAGQANLEEWTSGSPLTELTSEPCSAAVSDQDAPEARRVDEDVSLPKTPRSSATQPNAITHGPGVTGDSADTAYSPTNEYDFHFPSPSGHPLFLTSVTPSQNNTPSPSDAAAPSESLPTQDEVEVWHALMLEGSGVSTPLSDATSPMMFSHEPSRASSVYPNSLFSQPLSVDPSVLHDPLHATSSPHLSAGSLSSLTSLEDTDVDKDHTPTDGCSGVQRSRIPHANTPSDASRAALGATVVGGPSASLDELAMLSRRETAGGVRGVKRRRDDGGESGAVTERQSLDVGGGTGRKHTGQAPMSEVSSGDVLPTQATSIHVDTAARLVVTSQVSVSAPRKKAKKQTKGVEKEIHTHAAPKISGNVPSLASRSSMLIPNTSQLASENSNNGFAFGAEEYDDVIPDISSSHKRTKDSERSQKVVRGSKADSRSLTKYHIRNGQIVSMASEPLSQAPTVPSTSQLEEAIQDSRTPARIRHQEGRENLIIKTPPSSPANLNQRKPRSSRYIKPSPSKDDTWGVISRRAGTWPELPSVFSQWHIQFILCDNCDKWYHYGCVAIEVDDPRLEPEAMFICPTCHNESARRQTSLDQGDTCARPDCPQPQASQDSETYFVEKLVGRKKNNGYVSLWLVKWEGYPMAQATWIPRENIDGDGKKLFSAFLDDAVEEGADLSQEVVLLREAIDAGWV